MTKREWSDIISDDPHTIISLSRVAAIVNEFFHLDDDDMISRDTPFVWWDRSKRNIGISHPMPKPIGYVTSDATADVASEVDARDTSDDTGNGPRARGPLWHQDQIVHWFGQWKDLDIPECQQAGDRVSNRGHPIPSPHRVVS